MSYAITTKSLAALLLACYPGKGPSIRQKHRRPHIVHDSAGQPVTGPAA